MNKEEKVATREESLEKRIREEIRDNTQLGDINKLEERGMLFRYVESLFNQSYRKTHRGSNWTYKIDFLTTFIYENYSKSMFSQYITIFKKSKEIEEMFGIDLYDFSEAQMLSLLKNFRAKTYNSINNKYSLIKTYMQIAKKDKRGSVPVPSGMLLKANQITETLCTYVQEARYCTRAYIEQKVKKLENPVDRAIFMLLYEGVCGVKYEDLLELRVDDIDLANRKLTVKSGKVIEVSSYTNNILRNTIAETIYTKLGTEFTYKLDTASPYLIKGKLTVASGGNALKYAGFTRRIDAVKSIMEEEALTGGTVYRSGLVERVLMQQYKDKKHYTVEELKELLREWDELREGGDIKRIIDIIGEDVNKELEMTNYEKI